MALTDVRIGAARLYMNAVPGQQGSVDLGNTLDGCEVTIDRKFQDLQVDAYGETPIEKALIGMGMKIKVKLAEPTANNLQVALAEAANNNGTAGRQRTGIGRTAGYLLKSNGETFTLILRPIQNVALNTDVDDVVIYSAVSSEPITLPYKVKDQRVIEVTFTALVNETYEDGRRLGHVGPSTIS